MKIDRTQRWREGRSVFRPVGEPIDPSKYEVAVIPGDKVAKAFVVEHHYSGSYPAARVRVGLYRAGQLQGVAVFSVPIRGCVLDWLPCDRDHAVELGRFVLLDEVPSNGETWFLARCWEVLRRQGFEGVVSFSDPTPRTNHEGEVVFVGHLGTIYQAANATYAGRASARRLLLLPDGTVFSDRARSKIRSREQGWRYAVDILVAAGATEPTRTTSASLRAWLPGALAETTRPLKHGGNYRYLFGLTRAVKRRLPQGLDFPKVRVAGR